MTNDLLNKDTAKRAGSGRNYGLIMDKREHVALTGVSDVMTFDDKSVVLLTEGGEVTVSGSNLHVARLMLEEGQLVIDGTIDAITYREQKPQGKTSRVMGRLLK